MRDALSIFDQVAASTRGNITYASAIANLNVLDAAYYDRLCAAFVKGDVQSALLIYKEIRDHGFDTHFFITGLSAYIRDLMVARSESTLSLLDTDEDVKSAMAATAKSLPLEFYYAAMSLCNEADLNYRQASSKTFLAELLLIRLCQLQSPSPTYSGSGEGHLKPFATTAPSVASASSVAEAAPQTKPVTAGAPQPQHTGPVAPAPQPMTTPARPAATVATAPSAPVAGTPPPPPARTGRVLRTTHRTETTTADTHATRTAVTAMHRSERYTDEQVNVAWDSFAAAHPTEHILTNTMRACRPRNVGNDIYDVALENEIQTAEFRNHLPELLLHIRNAISNDTFNITLSINDSGPAPTIWNDREILAHITSVSPEIVKLIETFNLKLV